MTPLSIPYFAFRLGWRQLFFEKGKFFAAILGVTFACVLVFMQLGFRDALFDGIALPPNLLKGDLFIEHKQTEALWRSVPFDRSELARTYASPDVERAAPLYLNFGTWRNPVNYMKRTIFVMGMAPDLYLTNSPELTELATALLAKDTIAFDKRSRPEFGPVEKLLESGPLDIEISNYKLTTVGVFKLGSSFSADGTVVTNEQNFVRIFKDRNLDQVDIGIIQLKPGADVTKVKNQLRSILNSEVDIFDKSELIDHEMAYWKEMAPVGFVFGFGVVMGLVVGMVIVYQILYTDIVNHLREYATMKAMGYQHTYLLMVVFSCSLILAVIGFIPGLAISSLLYKYTEGIIYVDMPMPLSKILYVFAYILIMCILSGIIAIRKLREASPADMF